MLGKIRFNPVASSPRSFSGISNNGNYADFNLTRNHFSASFDYADFLDGDVGAFLQRADYSFREVVQGGTLCSKEMTVFST